MGQTETTVVRAGAGGRLAYLDWLRGLAAVIMLQGHAFHAFTKPDSRESGLYVLSQFIGGMPPAIFLFLLGVTLAFLMDSRERKGFSRFDKWKAGLKRAGYLFGIAFLFRLQMWIFGLPHSPWTDLLRVDILNAMGFAVAILSVMALFKTATRAKFCALLGAGIAAASPVVTQLEWSTPSLLASYVVPDFMSFGFFPWAAFVAFGMSAGSILRLERAADRVERLIQWAALLGLGLIVASQYFSGLPYSLYSKSDFWLNSPWLVMSKLGVILLLLSGAFVWTRYVVLDKWSWVRQFGMTSLLVYWVHVELMYGRWLWFWKERLTPEQAAFAGFCFILLMLTLSLLKTHWKDLRMGYIGGYALPFAERRASN